MAKIREAAMWENRVHDLCSDESVVEMEVDVPSKEEEVVEKDQGVELEHGEGQGEEVGGLRLLRRFDFWLYFFSYMFSGTLGLVFLNNLGQIAESRRLSDPSTLVSLSSSFGFFGRLLPAFLDYYTAK
jgi:hypothetical protein